jgi:hypothetical protein
MLMSACAVSARRQRRHSRKHMLFARFDVSIENTSLQATLWGEPVDVARHAPACELKGATYTALRVAREGEGWSAACVVDICKEARPCQCATQPEAPCMAFSPAPLVSL